MVKLENGGSVETLSREEIVTALQRKNKVEESQGLLKTIGHYLQRNPDMEVLQLIERSFGSTLGELQYYLAGGRQPDFADWYNGSCAWLKTYLEVTRTSEAPGVFHALSALTVASMLLGRQCWIDMDFYAIWPPLACILVGPSGLKKNAAMGIAETMLRHGQHEIITIKDRFTPAAFTSAIEKRDNPNSPPVAMVISPELSVTLGRASYLEGLVPQITRMLDQEGFEDRTQTRGIIKVPDLAFGFLGGTTPKWITEEMNSSVISGGFTSRFLFGYCEANPRMIYRSQSRSVAKLIALWEEAVDFAKDMKGVVRLEGGSDAFLEQWYYAHRLTSVDAELTSGYNNRKQAHMLRLAMILTMLSGQRHITVPYIQEAIGILDYLEPGMFKLFNRLTRSSTANDADLLGTLLREAGGRMDRTMLIRLAGVQMPYQRALECISYLEAGGMVQQENNKVIATQLFYDVMEV